MLIQPEIIEKPELLVAGFEATFIHALSPDADNLDVIGRLWDRLCPVADAIPLRSGPEMYGVIYCRSEEQKEHAHELQYIAAVPVQVAEGLPAGMTSFLVPATTFAVFTHRGPIAKIADTCEFIYRQWLPNSQYEHSDIADVELYDGRFTNDETSMSEYWVSVRPVA